jgi:uncharacterized membrane protein HdeD (DUF308 family)
MRTDLRRLWWALAIRGLAGVLIGILAFAMPGITLAVLVALFAAWLLVDGIFALVAGLRSRSWLVALEGVLGVVVGIVAVALPGATALALLLLAAAWAVLTGAIEVAAAVMLRRLVTNELWLLFGGIVSIAFGVLLVLNPRAGLLVLTWFVGAYALVSGVILLALALRLRSSMRMAHTLG